MFRFLTLKNISKTSLLSFTSDDDGANVNANNRFQQSLMYTYINPWNKSFKDS